MSKFPKRFGPDVEVEVVDLDAADIEYRGEALTETRAEEVAAEVLPGTFGMPTVTVTAAYAARRLPELLDRVERGETVRITRAGHGVAELRHVTPSTGRRQREVVAGAPALDDGFQGDVDAAAGLAATDDSHREAPVDPRHEPRDR